MDLTTHYLGKTLRSPLVASASPLTDAVDNIRHMEDIGIAAVVLYSLFEEQLNKEQLELHYHTTTGTESFAEALTYFPEPDEYRAGPEGYLEHIRKCKEAVDIPVIGSLNGSTLGGWTRFAKDIEDAGADAIEVNVYSIPSDPYLTGAQVEENTVEIVKAVKSAVSIPVAVKLSPYFSNMANMAYQLNQAGADALVLFNRFYQPDIDLEELVVVPNVLLSTPQDLRLPLRWIAMLHARFDLDLAATSGVHSGDDVLKLMMVGANVAMMASTLLRNGLDHVSHIKNRIVDWMEEHEYESIQQMQGSMSQRNVKDASAFERAQYMHAVTSVPSEAFKQQNP